MNVDLHVVGGQLRRALHWACRASRMGQPRATRFIVTDPSPIISALELPDTPHHYRDHVRTAISLSYDLLTRCQDLGGCYGAVYDAVVAMDEAKRLNVHLHSGPDETEDDLHAEDCQLLAEAVLSMSNRSLAQLVDRLDSAGYLFPHHLDGVPLDGQPWATYKPQGWIDTEARVALESIWFPV